MDKNIYTYKTPKQVDLPWGETFSMAKKAPAVANRIFTTLNDAQAYVDNINDSATEGIRITVLKDYLWITDSEGRNYGDDGYVKTEGPIGDYSGVYYVKSIGDGETPGELVKLGRGDVAWFRGNAVSEDGSIYKVYGSKLGDLYLNNDTLDLYELTENESLTYYWKFIANLNIQPPTIHTHQIYYILSDNNQDHPEWDINKWSKEIPTNYDDFDGKSVYLWSRIYDEDDNEYNYLVSLIYSSLNLGTFKL